MLATLGYSGRHREEVGAKVAFTVQRQVASHLQRVLDDAHKNRMPHCVVSPIAWIC